MTQQHTPMWVLAGVAVLIVVCATVLIGFGKTEPSWFQNLAFLALGGGAGVAVPITISKTTETPTAAPAAPAPVVTPPAAP